jgi:hypothetical protein
MNFIAAIAVLLDHLTSHSVKASSRTLRVRVSVLAKTLPSFFVNRPLSTARI